MGHGGGRGLIVVTPQEAIDTLAAGRDLTPQQAEDLFAAVMAGEVPPFALAGVLVALKAKGETAAEIAGAARAMRQAATPFDTEGQAVGDSCGTGGDGAGTVNISTAAAFVAASAGVRMAKHGNRSVSSQCGSADVLERAGVRIEASPARSQRALREAGICFLYAPQYHPGVRHAMPVRRGLGVRTLFNLLGPLGNPAAPEFQLVGVYDPTLCVRVAETLHRLGCGRALVVHGGGLDEIALHAPTTAARLERGRVTPTTLTPEGLGLTAAPLEALRGEGPETAAAWLEGLLAGRGSRAHRDAVAANAGAVLWLAGHAESLVAGVAEAGARIDDGAAVATLAALRRLTAEDVEGAP